MWETCASGSANRHVFDPTCIALCIIGTGLDLASLHRVKDEDRAGSVHDIDTDAALNIAYAGSPALYLHDLDSMGSLQVPPPEILVVSLCSIVSSSNRPPSAKMMR